MLAQAGGVVPVAELSAAFSLAKYGCHHLQQLALSHSDRLADAVSDAGAAAVLLGQLTWMAGAGPTLERYLSHQLTHRERFEACYDQARHPVARTLVLQQIMLCLTVRQQITRRRTGVDVCTTLELRTTMKCVTLTE